MSAAGIKVGDRVRARASQLEDVRVGVCVRIGDQTPHPSYGEPFTVGVRLDDGGYLDGSTFGYRLSELEPANEAKNQNALETGATVTEGESESRANGSQQMSSTNLEEGEPMSIMAPRPGYLNDARPEDGVTPLVGGLAEGLRNDPENDLEVRLRTATNGSELVELEIDGATSGFDNIAWLTPQEAFHLALNLADKAIRALGEDRDAEWDNEKVAKERRRKWAAVDERAKASDALTTLIGSKK